jgi:hypothetical protein
MYEGDAPLNLSTLELVRVVFIYEFIELKLWICVICIWPDCEHTPGSQRTELHHQLHCLQVLCSMGPSQLIQIHDYNFVLSIGQVVLNPLD